MRTSLMLLCVVTVATGSDAAAADTLHRREVQQRHPGGKDLVMTFEGLRRDEKVSLARVIYVSRASVPSSLFIVRGFYDIVRRQGATYFITLKEWQAEDGTWMYRVGFSNNTRVAPEEYFDLSGPVEQQFMAVSDFDPIFQGNQ